MLMYVLCHWSIGKVRGGLKMQLICLLKTQKRSGQASTESNLVSQEVKLRVILKIQNILMLRLFL